MKRQSAKSKIIISSLSFVLLFPPSLSAREFDAEGSDLLMGVGPEQISLGSAVAASDNGVFSLFWNPAALVSIKRKQIAVAGQIDRRLSHISFAGIAFPLPKSKTLGLRSVLGFSYLPRANFTANGTFKSGEMETTFMQSGLPGFIGGFSGKLSSKTVGYRIGLGANFDALPSLDLGISLGKIKCHTLFEGYHKDDGSNFTKKEIWANAWSLDLGSRYHIDEKLTAGIVLKNIFADLDVKTVTTDNSGTHTRYFSVPYVYDLSAGLKYRYMEKLRFMLTYQSIFGQYNKSTFDIKMLRAGAGWRRGDFDYHLGIVAPLKISGSHIKDVKLPAPAMPTFGISYIHEGWKFDAALYFHPIKSLAAHSPKPVADFSLSYKF